MIRRPPGTATPAPTPDPQQLARMSRPSTDRGRHRVSGHNGPEVSGGSSDGRAPVSGDEWSRTPQQASRRSGGPGFDSPPPLTSRTWTLPLTITAPLSMNGREHWRVKAKLVKQVRDDADFMAREALIPELAAFTVELHYVPRDKRRRDPENLIATLKPFVDGLIDAGVAPDDCPPYYTTTVPIIDPPGRVRGHLYAVVREMPVDLGAQYPVEDTGEDVDPRDAA